MSANLRNAALKILAANLSLAALAACGGSEDSDLSPGGNSPEVRSVPFLLNGGEAPLNLNNTDQVLAAAQAAIVAAFNVDAADFLDIDSGSPPPGQGRISCDSGSLVESVGGGGGTRSYSLRGDQCYFDDADGEVLLDGQISFDISSGAGSIFGTVTAGSGVSAPLLALGRDPGEPEYEFGQIVGDIAFDGDADTSPITSTTSLVRFVSGLGTPTPRGTPFTPDRGVEIRAGSTSVSFRVDSALAGSGRLLSLSGPLSVQGVDLNPECNFTARFNVSTNTAVQFGDDSVARNGLVVLSPVAGGVGATVQFDGAGAARVTPASGPVADYTAGQVASFCGL